jgi:hypothetical protein
VQIRGGVARLLHERPGLHPRPSPRVFQLRWRMVIDTDQLSCLFFSSIVILLGQLDHVCTAMKLTEYLAAPAPIA